MSDHYKGCWVAFKDDISGEYAQRIVDAIRLLDPVQDVSLNVANYDDWNARSRVYWQMRKKIFDLFKDDEPQ